MKRKYLIFQDTIRAYKALTAPRTKAATEPEKAAEPGEPIKAPAPMLPAVIPAPKATKKARRKGSYYIKTVGGVVLVDGWIFTINDLEIGAKKEGKIWTITDLKSGMACGSAWRLDEVPSKVAAVADKLKELHADKSEKMLSLFREIEKAYLEAAG